MAKNENFFKRYFSLFSRYTNRGYYSRGTWTRPRVGDLVQNKPLNNNGHMERQFYIVLSVGGGGGA